MNPPYRMAALLAALFVAGCAVTPPSTIPNSVAETAKLPAQWLSPLPHQGSASALSDWWRQFQDPVLLQLIEQAQQASPTLKAAVARLDEARAVTQSAESQLRPSLSGSAQLSRGRVQAGTPVTSVGTAQFNAGWELDLFGAARAQAQASSLQADAAQSQWHAARVSLAADVASAYLSLRHAQAQEEVSDFDVRAAKALAQWGALQRQAGLISASDAALLNTQLAAAESLRADQRAETQVALQSIALLCAQPAQQLAELLVAPALGELPQRRIPTAPAFELNRLPPQALAQRPDLVAAHQQWLAAAYDEQGARMQELPQVSLGALLGRQTVRLQGANTSGNLWQLAPSLSLPIFNGGNLAAQTQAATARTAQASAQFEQRWREVVNEVEDALQRVQAAQERRKLVDAAHLEWKRIADDAVRLAAAGVQSGPQRATTQRTALAAYSALLAVHQEQAQAWIRLYRSLGGGWSSAPEASAPNAKNS
jgi:multidrug efflux system outer membrane protein